MSARRKPPATPRPRKAVAPAPAPAAAAPAPAPAPQKPDGGDPLAAIARAQEGQLSAEGFWKAAGRFTKLR